MLLLIFALYNSGSTLGQLTLVNSAGEPHTGEGWALLLYNGGTVCDDYFGMKEASVICRHLGYTDALTWGSVEIPNGNNIVTWNVQYNYAIKLDDVQCPVGGYWNQCTYITSGLSSWCIRTDDVLLYCTGKQFGF